MKKSNLDSEVKLPVSCKPLNKVIQFLMVQAELAGIVTFVATRSIYTYLTMSILAFPV